MTPFTSIALTAFSILAVHAIAFLAVEIHRVMRRPKPVQVVTPVRRTALDMPPARRK